MSQKTADETRPLTLQVTISVPALVYPEPEVGGFSAEVPALPGCYTQGETIAEIEENLRDAIAGWLAVAHDEGVQRSAENGGRT